MCTAVVGGLTHRAATRISAANDQRSATPMTSHRIKDRRKAVRSRALVSVFGIAVTSQNNSLGWVGADTDEMGLSNSTRWRSCCIKESEGELCGAKRK